MPTTNQLKKRTLNHDNPAIFFATRSYLFAPSLLSK